MNLVDMFVKAQGGQAVDALSSQFNLSQQQTVAALEALMPAFSQGLQRNAADPMGFGGFVQALSAGRQVNYFDNPQAAFNPSGIANGKNILDQLFGSKDLSRAVADHAAAVSGVGADTLKQMLPVIASMMMGGLYKKSTGQFAASGLGGGNVIGDFIEQMMRQGGNQTTATQQGVPGAGANPWGQILESMLGGGAAGGQTQQQGQGNPLGNNPLGKIFEEMMKNAGGAAQQAPAPRDKTAPQDTAQGQNPFGDNPLGKIFEEMMKGAAPGGRAPQDLPQDEAPRETAQGQNPFGDNPLGQIFGEIFGGGAQQPSPAPQSSQPQRPKAPQGTPAQVPSDNPLKDILGQMFDTGKQANDQYQKGVESIFEQYKRGMDRYR